MIKSGFFDSFQGDRKYNAEDFGGIFDGIISDGILNSYGDHFACSFSGMDVTVGSGKGWFKRTWIINDDNLVLTCENNTTGKKRIDTVVIDVNKTDDVRNNAIFIIKGGTSHPPLVDAAAHKQYPLYDVTIAASGNVIESITDRRMESTAQLNIANIDKNNTIVPFWPVGSIYMSVSNIEPSTIFGGTWERLKDRFLIGAGTDFEPGATGGSWNHTITTDHLPTHFHHMDFWCTNATPETFMRRTYDNEKIGVMGWAQSRGNDTKDSNVLNHLPAAWNFPYSIQGSSKLDIETMVAGPSAYDTAVADAVQNPHNHNILGDTQSVGSSSPMDIKPPYLAVYMWKRIS